ncbi:hypothetical protein MLD38_009015 [Melastoma candidum]|uniref:Uncharacterized protein n=1 Tax=Melastoma candidum TaxID=119954 RepID=A0ACB9RWD7_9MYRT|nr:hypothetical protein MLD38_009015 [Melastoma candidum]
MADEWDLSAIVRSCGAVASPSADTSTSSPSDMDNPLSCLASLTFDEDAEGSFASLSPATSAAPLDELEALYRSFFPATSNAVPNPTLGGSVSSLTAPIPSWNNPALSVPQPLTYPWHDPQRPRADPPILPAVRPQAPNSKAKKRKTQPKSVCHFTGETLSSDPWAWRKYGQKPIKGSPYPRSYYRCSSSKACMARKQVERSGDDPNIFVVMYTGEHSHPLPTHRNSLAGSTRNKYSSLSSSSSPQKKPAPAAASDNPDLSPVTPLPSPGLEDTANSENNDDVFASMMDEDDFDLAGDDWLIPNMGMSEEILAEYRHVSDDPGQGQTQRIPQQQKH